MIISINEKQEVIAVFDGVGVEADNEISFEVENVPQKRAGKILCYDVETGTFYGKDREPVDEEAVKERKAKAAERRAAQEQKAAALKWLTENDWKVNKHTLGEWTDDDPRWLEYIAGREQARKDYDEAVAALEA